MRPPANPRLCAAAVLVALALPAVAQDGQRTVRARVQPRPGAPAEEIDMRVHEVPVDPPTVAADEAPLEDLDLVLGLIVEGMAIAYPVRFLATVEVINDTVGSTSLAPTW